MWLLEVFSKISCRSKCVNELVRQFNLFDVSLIILPCDIHEADLASLRVSSVA